MNIESLLSAKAIQILKQNPGVQSKIASRVAQIQAEAMAEANAQYNSELANTKKANKSAQEATSKSKLEEEIHNNRKIVSNQEPRKDVAWNRNNSFSYPNSNGSVTSNTNFSKEYVAPKYPLALSDAKNPYNAVITEARANANEYSELVQAESKSLAVDRSNIALKNKQNSLLLEESIQTENLINSQSTGGIEWTPKSNKLSVPDGRHLPALTTDNNVFEELNKNAKLRANENVKRAADKLKEQKESDSKHKRIEESKSALKKQADLEKANILKDFDTHQIKLNQTEKSKILAVKEASWTNPLTTGKAEIDVPKHTLTVPENRQLPVIYSTESPLDRIKTVSKSVVDVQNKTEELLKTQAGVDIDVPKKLISLPENRLLPAVRKEKLTQIPTYTIGIDGTEGLFNFNFESLPAQIDIEEELSEHVPLKLTTNTGAISPIPMSANGGLGTTQFEKPHYKYSITNLDDLIKNGGGQVELFNKTLNEKVPFDKFGISIEEGEASVGYVEKDSVNGRKHKGAAREAYKILGEELGSKGIQFHDSGALLGDGRELWNSLVVEGKAEKVGSGFNYKPSTKPTGVITPDTPGSDIIKVGPPTVSQNTVKKIYAGADSNIPIELVGDEIVDTDRNWRGYKTTTGSFVESERLFNTNKEADEYISKLNKSSTQPKTSKSINSTSKSVSTQTPPVNKAYSTYNYIGDANSLSKVPLTGKGTPNGTKVKVGGNTSVVSNFDKPVKPINRGGSLRESLKGMGIYVLDTETTGLQKKDKMFSAAYSKTTGKIINTTTSTVNSTFDINVNANKRAFIDASGNYDANRHISAVENNLRKAHSSRKFGEEQYKRGSLRSIAEDIVNGRLTTHDQFLTSLANSMNVDKEGSVVFAHNTNFENSVFNNIRDGQRNTNFSTIFDALQYRNISNSRGLFSVYHSLSNPTKVIDNQGSVQKANRFYNEYMIDSIKSGDRTRIKDTLNSYASKQMDVIDDLINQIKVTKLKQGAYSTVDTMHIQRALMSFGALSGDVDVANLRLGNSIDVMSKAWGFGPEQHTALDDIDKQRKITDILIEEVDNFRKDANYKSSRLATLNKYINENDIGTETYKKTILNEFMNKVTSKDDHKALTKLNEFIEQQNSVYEVASGNHQERLNFATAFNAEKDKLLADKQLGLKAVKDRLEQFTSPPGSVDSQSTRTSNKAAQGFDVLEHLKSNKGKYAIGAAVVAGSLLVGGGVEGKEEKYNTYDELYNGMYYGSPFADWQERNNAHKILY